MIRHGRILCLVSLLAALPALAQAASIQVNPGSLTIQEGGTGSVQVRLSNAPGSPPVPIKIRRISGDGSISVVSGASLSFEAIDWNIWQTVTFKAAADDDTDNGVATFEAYDSRVLAPVYGQTAFTITESDTTEEKEEDEFTDESGEVISPEEYARQRRLAELKRYANLYMATGLGQRIVRRELAGTPAPRGANGPVVADWAPSHSDEAVASTEALAEVPPTAMAPVWNLNLTSNARYAERTYHDAGHASSHHAGFSLRSAHHWGNLSLEATVPVDIADYGQTLDHLDNIRTGIVLAPRYALLQEERHGIDLAVGATAYYMRTFLTSSYHDSNLDHAGYGLLVSARKTLGPVVLAAGVLGQQCRNLDNDKELTGEHTLEVLTAGMNAGLPVGENWLFNAYGLYNHVPEMPRTIDQDTFLVGGSVSYLLADKWSLSLSAATDVMDEDQRSVEIHLGLGWTF